MQDANCVNSKQFVIMLTIQIPHVNLFLFRMRLSKSNSCHHLCWRKQKSLNEKVRGFSQLELYGFEDEFQAKYTKLFLQGTNVHLISKYFSLKIFKEKTTFIISLKHFKQVQLNPKKVYIIQQYICPKRKGSLFSMAQVSNNKKMHLAA